MDKLKFFKAVLIPDPIHASHSGIRQTEIYLPVDAISHLTLAAAGNRQGGYNIHIKKNYPLGVTFPVKDIVIEPIKSEFVEVI